MSQWVAGSGHCDPRGWEKSKGCRAQSVRQCSLVRCREQRLSECSPSMRDMSENRKRKAPESGERGERKGSLRAAPRCRAEGCCGVCQRLRGKEGVGRVSPSAAGHGPSAPQRGAQPGLWLPAAIVGPAISPPPPPSPALPLSQHSKQRAWPWEQSSGTPGPARCSLLLIFALSSPVCMLCRQADVDPNICGRTFAQSGLYVHEFCLVSSNAQWLLPPSCQGCSLPFCPNEILLCSFLCCSILPTSSLKESTPGRKLCASPLVPSEAKSSRRTRR